MEEWNLMMAPMSTKRFCPDPLEKIGFLMLLTSLVTLTSYLYLCFSHIYGPNVIHWLYVCLICFFTYKEKKWARICYYIFSAILVFIGIIGLLTIFLKTQGRLLWIEVKAVWLSIGRAALQVLAVYLLHKWTCEGKPAKQSRKKNQ